MEPTVIPNVIPKVIPNEVFTKKKTTMTNKFFNC